MSHASKRHREESAPIDVCMPSSSSVDLDAGTCDALAEMKTCKKMIHTFATIAVGHVLKLQKKHGAFLYCASLEERNRKVADFLETLACLTDSASVEEEEQAFSDGKAQYSIGEHGCGRCPACGSSLTGAQCDCEC